MSNLHDWVTGGDGTDATFGEQPSIRAERRDGYKLIQVVPRKNDIAVYFDLGGPAGRFRPEFVELNALGFLRIARVDEIPSGQEGEEDLYILFVNDEKALESALAIIG